MKIIRYIFIFCIILAVILFSAGIYISNKYSSQVTQITVDEFNKYLQSKIEVKNISFSVFKKFPYASLEFSGVVMFEPEENSSDTLFYSENLSLHFNIMEIWEGNYNIRKIQVEKGFVRPRVNKDGIHNYHFWRTPETEQEEENLLDLQLNNISLHLFDIDYADLNNIQQYKAGIKKAQLTGNFSSSGMLLTGEADLFAEKIQVAGVTYLAEQKVKTGFTLQIDEESLQIQNGNLQVSGMDFDLSGKIGLSEKKEVDISVRGKNLDIQSFLSLMPEKVQREFKQYNSQGNFYFNLNLSGQVSDNKAPALHTDFGIKDGSVFHSASSVKLEKINLTGNYHTHNLYRAENGKLSLKGFSAVFQNGIIKGDVELTNLAIPSLDISLYAETELAELADFFKIDTLSHISGKLLADLSFSGKIKDFKPEDLSKARTSGKVILTGIHFGFVQSPHKHEDIHAELLFKNNDIIIKNLAGNISGSDYQMKGFLRNIIAWLWMENERLVVDASFRSEKLDLNSLLAENSNAGKDTVYELVPPQNSDWHLNLEVDELIFRRFHAKNISGKASLKNQKLTADKLVFESLDGKADISGYADASNRENILVKCQANLSGINIEKLFYQMEDFGQDFIREKHIKGIGHTKVELSLELDKHLNINTDKIDVQATLTIEKGELVNFEPLNALSAFINVSELEHVKFSTLKNTIEIRNRQILIPNMDINSSAINIGVSGIHSFDDKIDYRFRILLNEILSGKARNENKNISEFGFIEDSDRRKINLFIAMTGTVDKPRFSYDRAGLTNKMKQDVHSEKRAVKSILKDEFGLYKKDTSLSSPQKNKPVNHQVEWEEYKKDTQETRQEKKLPPVKTEKSKFDKWLNKISGPENPKEYEEAED